MEMGKEGFQKKKYLKREVDFFIKVVFHQDGLTSGCSFIMLVLPQSSLSSGWMCVCGWSYLRMV